MHRACRQVYVPCNGKRVYACKRKVVHTSFSLANSAVEGNKLTGSIPSEWGSLRANEVDLSDNSLSGEIETQLQPWLTNVRYVHRTVAYSHTMHSISCSTRFLRLSSCLLVSLLLLHGAYELCNHSLSGICFFKNVLSIRLNKWVDFALLVVDDGPSRLPFPPVRAHGLHNRRISATSPTMTGRVRRRRGPTTAFRVALQRPPCECAR